MIRGAKQARNIFIFPRYHQLETVRRLIAHARLYHAGQHYLIQHSAGSGKSNTIAWTTHQLSNLHDEADERVFDSIIVITDRRILDQQLQRTMRQFEQTRGIVENIDKRARQLKDALEDGKTIVVTTLQKFPFIVNEISSMQGKRFAVLIDEAHSSQTGESSSLMKKALTALSLEEAEKEEGQEGRHGGSHRPGHETARQDTQRQLLCFHCYPQTENAGAIWQQACRR